MTPVRLEPAKDTDAAATAALRLAVARELTSRYGLGTWSYAAESEAGARADILSGHVWVARDGGILAATLRLSPRQPWMGEINYFTPTERPMFLTSMAVAPKLQRHGIGRGCLEDVKRIAHEWSATAIRLDAYDAPAGAGDFYRKSGYREVKRAPYNGTPLIFFEYLLNGTRAFEARPAPP